MRVVKVIVFFCAMFMNRFVFSQQSLLFDTLFPVFWYEKGIQATMKAISLLRSLANADSAHPQLEPCLTTVIGHLAFAHFCVVSMNKDVRPIDEDIIYFSRLLHQLDPVVSAILCVRRAHDQLGCLMLIMDAMHEQLQVDTNI